MTTCCRRASKRSKSRCSVRLHGIASGTTTKLADRLERRRIARRTHPEATDRRAPIVIATATGVELIEHDLDQILESLPPTHRRLTDEQRVIAERVTLTAQRAGRST
jgi:DNA-binding MarR family transcriptional regulator